MGMFYYYPIPAVDFNVFTRNSISGLHGWAWIVRNEIKIAREADLG